MLNQWTLCTPQEDLQSDEELRQIFGEEAIVSRLGRYNLIHLDSPDPEEVARREAEFNPADLFEDDCPLCQMLMEQGANVVYDDGA